MHTHGITHRDLKPENLMLDANYNLKVIDFGFAIASKAHDGSGVAHTYKGTAMYMSPELHLGQGYNPLDNDMFSIAVILFVMLSAAYPFNRAAVDRDPKYNLIIN